MKIKALAALCKASKSICIYDRQNGATVEQWIGDGFGLYPITGLPYLDEESVCYLFDVPQDKLDEWVIIHDTMPCGLNVEDAAEFERELEPPKIEIKASKRIFLPFDTDAGIRLIDRAHFAPIADILNAAAFFERHTPEGGPYIAIKLGFILHAVILPGAPIEEQFAARMEQIAWRRRYAVDHAAAREAEAIRRHINAETGEIMDDSSLENGVAVTL